MNPEKSIDRKLSCVCQVSYTSHRRNVSIQLCLIQAHSKGLTNTVCTFYELTHGDQTTDEGSYQYSIVILLLICKVHITIFYYYFNILLFVWFIYQYSILIFTFYYL